MPMMVLKNPASHQVVGRGLVAEDIYDTEALAASNALTKLTYFSNAIGAKDASGTYSPKGYGETNMQQPRQLPKGFRFDCWSYNLKFMGNTAGNPITRVDFDNFRLRGFFEFRISDIRVSLRQISDIPFGADVEGTGTNVLIQGTPHIFNAVNLRYKGYNPTIESGEMFFATATWDTAPTTVGVIRSQCNLHGLLLQPL